MKCIFTDIETNFKYKNMPMTREIYTLAKNWQVLDPVRYPSLRRAIGEVGNQVREDLINQLSAEIAEAIVEEKKKDAEIFAGKINCLSCGSEDVGPTGDTGTMEISPEEDEVEAEEYSCKICGCNWLRQCENL